MAAEEVPTVPTQCIAVDSPDHTYLCTESMIPTHNTGHSVMPDAIAKAIADWRYDVQEAHYLAGLWELMRLGLLTEADVLYALAFVEKTPPYDVVIRQIGPKTRMHARIQRRWALERFATCRDTGTWPGYDDPAQRDDDEIPEIEVPGWKLSRWDYKTENGDYDVPEF